MLAGKGFDKVINMSGGIKAWNSNTAVGPEDLGLQLFDGEETLEDVLIIAYSMEKGLQDFYLALLDEVKSDGARKLFETLSGIEIKHQERIFAEYRKISPIKRSIEDFEEDIVVPVMEGGLTTKDYLDRYNPDLENEGEVVSLAMAIEAQALDLYQRTADRRESGDIREALLRIANEEREHLRQLGSLLDEL